jgi:hypothetical protein
MPLLYSALHIGHFSSKDSTLYETHRTVDGIRGNEETVSKAFAGNRL